MSDSEIGSVFESIRQQGQEKRASNRKTTPEVLAAAGIEFVTKNAGAHLIVFDGPRRYDLWPGTGKWWRRLRGKSHVAREARGVFNMIEDINRQRRLDDERK